MFRSRFSRDGRTLVTVGCDDNHALCVWDWENDTMSPVFEYRAIKEDLFGLQFKPTENSLEFVTYGAKHLKFWAIKEVVAGVAGTRVVSYVLDCKGGVLGEIGQLQAAFYSVHFLSDTHTAVGTSSGDIYVYNGNILESIMTGHVNAPCSVLTVLPLSVAFFK
jgi:hypothetical protein